jgi:hypothetical protein
MQAVDGDIATGAWAAGQPGPLHRVLGDRPPQLDEGQAVSPDQLAGGSGQTLRPAAGVSRDALREAA